MGVYWGSQGRVLVAAALLLFCPPSWPWSTYLVPAESLAQVQVEPLGLTIENMIPQTCIGCMLHWRGGVGWGVRIGLYVNWCQFLCTHRCFPGLFQLWYERLSTVHAAQISYVVKTIEVGISQSHKPDRPEMAWIRLQISNVNFKEFPSLADICYIVIDTHTQSWNKWAIRTYIQTIIWSPSCFIFHTESSFAVPSN